jgi:hypothetical protein
MSICENCREYISDYDKSHRCPPAWLVWWPETERFEEDAQLIFASNDADAATAFSQRYDWNSASFSIVGGQDAWLCVRPAAGGPITWFRVEGRSEPVYEAKAIQFRPASLGKKRLAEMAAAAAKHTAEQP